MGKIVQRTSEEMQALQDAGLTETDWERADLLHDDDYEDPEFDLDNAVTIYDGRRNKSTIQIDTDIMAWLRDSNLPAKEYINNLIRQQMPSES